MVLAKLKARSLLFYRKADCTKYWYDGVGQIIRLLNPFQENTTFSYDSVGRRTMQKLANRVRASYSYDVADRLTTLANVRADATYVSRYDYGYDNIINKTQVAEASGDRVTWNYDTTYQLTRERRSGTYAYDTTYAYDAAMNRSLMIDSGTRTTYVCDVANQLKWLQDGTGRTTFNYDNNGNQTHQIVQALTRTTSVWDGENRLSQMNRSSTDLSTYTYKSENNLRVVAEEPVATSRIIWDGQAYLEEANVSSVTQATYSNEPTQYGNLLSQSRSAVSSFYHADAQGSVTNLTNSAGTVTDSYLYKAFGSKIAAFGSTMNSFMYLGMLEAYQTSYTYSIIIGSRFYNASIARYFNGINGINTPSNKFILLDNSPFAASYTASPSLTTLRIDGKPKYSWCGGFNFNMLLDTSELKGRSPTVVQKMCYSGQSEICNKKKCYSCEPESNKNTGCCVWEPFWEIDGSITIARGIRDNQFLNPSPDECCSSRGRQTRKGTFYVFDNPTQQKPPSYPFKIGWTKCGDTWYDFNNGTISSNDMPSWLSGLKLLAPPVSWTAEIIWDCCDPNLVIKTMSLEISIHGGSGLSTGILIEPC